MEHLAQNLLPFQFMGFFDQKNGLFQSQPGALVVSGL